MSAELGTICVACDRPVLAGTAIQNHWGQRLHGNCPHPPRCDGCSVWIPAEKGHRLPDDRLLCQPCIAHGVIHPVEATPLLEQTVRELTALGLRVDVGFPIQVVDQSGLRDLAMSRRSLGHTATRPGTGRWREVTRVVIVSHLRPAHFRGVAAHELTHAYLHQRVPLRLPRAVAEGLCNYAASRIYQGAAPDPVAAFLLGQLERDPDPHYGDGYRRVRDAIRGDDERLRRLLAALEAGRIPQAMSPNVVEWASGHLKLLLRRVRW